MITSPFSTSQPKKDVLIPDDVDVVFVADMFAEQYVGGAELTTDALIKSSTFSVFCVNSQDVTVETLQSGHKKYWIFGNFANFDLKLIPTVVANLKYSILEYDYKFCRYRSIEKHLANEKKECDCHEDVYGKLISAFFYGSRSLWFMSEAQQGIYFDRFPFLREKENWVLSSVFDDQFFITVKMLREKYKDVERKGWLVVGSDSWIKGTQAAAEWCEKNNKEYKLIQGWEYGKVLEEMAQAEGFVYLPPGGDTCPRTVIEAKLLGCELHLNSNVQHKDEEWFSGVPLDDTEAYLYAARSKFWNSIAHSMNYHPTLSGYTTTFNCIENGYPWEESITSMLQFCDEVVVVDGGSTDGTWEKLQKLFDENSEKLVIKKNNRNWDHPRFAVFDGDQKAVARQLCTSQFCWQQDADEIVHEDDYKNVIDLLRNFPTSAELISLPVIEYWGGPEKIRLDVNPWKWRLSRNLPHITHGVPKELRKFDNDGNLYAAPGTDGCDYIHKETFERINHATFYTEDIHNCRVAAASGDKQAAEQYQEWFNSLITQLPGVHHYSWFNMSRKIKTYKNYWQKHWESLYDITQEDTAENNMFFQRPWSEVSDEDIDNLAQELSEKMGGWVFHTPVDFSKPTPHLRILRNQPAIMIKE
tara:strand:+ start:960 stop:2885 length:1926 start_codon:yes stop_codon:yes gene_type:complete